MKTCGLPPRSTSIGTDLPTSVAGQMGKERIMVGDGLPGDADQDITHDQSGGFSRAFPLHTDQQQAAGLFAVKVLLGSFRKFDRLAAHAQVAALDRTRAGELVGHFPGISAGMVSTTPRPKPEVFTPTTCPSASTSGPPEKPG